MVESAEMDLESEIHQICTFLRRRGVPEEVIERFRDEKMDFSAVSNATDQQLSDLGVLRRGDLLSLRGFVKEKLRGENRDDKKRKLLDLLREKVKPRKRKAVDNTSSRSGSGASIQSKERGRKIQLGWLQFDPQQKKFVAVRHAKGGGTRTIKP